MDDRQRRIIEDLTGVLKGEVRCDAVSTAVYAADASLYQIRPVGVAMPRDAEDVGVLARYAAEQELPLVPRGAGTSVAGAAVGAGLVVDFSRYMTRVLDDQGDTLRVEPGVVLERLNRRLRASGRYFPPDPATASVTTIGGMIATNAAGSHSVLVGTTRDHVRSLATVLAGGQEFEAGLESLRAITAAMPSTSEATTSESTKQILVSRLAALFHENADRIEAKRTRAKRNNCGYHVWNVLTATDFDLAGLLVGSEGTLGLFNAATIKVSPLPAFRGVVLILYDEIDAAFEAVQAVLPLHPAACDLIDRRSLSLAREGDQRFEAMIRSSAEAALLLEVVGDSGAETHRRLDEIIRAASASHPTVAARSTTDDDQDAVDFLWTLPGKIVPRLTKLRGLTRPLPIVEDIAVPPEAMQEFRLRAQKVFQRHQVTATLYAHAGHGQMHFRPFLPPPEVGGSVPLEALARDLYQIVLSLGGVVSGEHGDGLARTAFIRTQYGPLYRVFQQIKEIFDPHGLLNPGKIVSDDPKATVRHLRPVAPVPPAIVDLNLRWSPQRMAEEAVRCNGCGACRTQEPGLRMCPFFRVTPGEEAAPRSKATAMRLVASGELTAEDMASPEMAHLASLCFNCKQCERECPSEVDIPHMVLEAKSARVTEEGLKWPDWALSRAHSIGPIGSGFSFATNRLLGSPVARWLLEKTTGVSRYRKLPPYARRPFLRSLPRRCRSVRTGPNGQKAVIYFVDEFANRFDPDLARAFVAVMERQGVPVFVPTDQLPSGMSLVSAGDLAAARELAEENLRVLSPFARDGHRIVCTEPSAAVCLRREYPFLLEHPDVEIVAKQTTEAGAFLAELDAAGSFDRKFHPLKLSVGYHTPCHVRSENPEEPFHRLLALIPDLHVHKIESGCSGMAGTWGLSAHNFRMSLRMGWPLITAMRDGQFTCGTTECSSCKMQMEQGTLKPTLHPLKLLAWSYAGQAPVLPKSASRLLTS